MKHRLCRVLSKQGGIFHDESDVDERKPWNHSTRDIHHCPILCIVVYEKESVGPPVCAVPENIHFEASEGSSRQPVRQFVRDGRAGLS